MTHCYGVLTARTTLFLLVLGLLSSFDAAAQGTFTLRIRGQDTGGGVDTLLYGRDPRGTYCIDPGVTFYEGTRGFTEFELPPAPPSGVFDFRLSNQRPGLGGCTPATERGNGLRYDVRGSTSQAQVDTFQLKFQIGTTGPISLFWQSELTIFCDSMRLKDLFGGFLVNLNMLSAQTLVVPNPAITQLNIIMYRAPGVALIAPSDGVTVPVSLTLTWNLEEDATKYRVQVATDSNFTNLVVHDSTVAVSSRLVSGLSGSTTYYWRVSAGNNLGWGAYSTRRSFITEATGNPPGIPTLISPADGASGQPLSIGFTWSSATDATQYHIQVATDSAFASGIITNDSTLTDTTRTVSGLAYSTAYYWRVRGRNGFGNSIFTPHRNLTTQDPPVPPMPSLVSPANGATNQPTTLTFRWNVSAAAAQYELQVATDSTFTSGIVFGDSTLTDTSRTVSGLGNDLLHYWRVRAKNVSGSSAFSGIRNFTTQIAPPPAPTPLSPSNGQTGVTVPVNISWTASTGASFYRLIVGTDSTFATGVVFNDSTITGTSQSVGALGQGVRYYWRVTARNAGGTSPPSPAWNFTTLLLPPATPTLVSPANGATNQPTSITFVWNRSSGATNYRLQVATDSNFVSGIAFNDSTLTDSSRTVTSLALATTYYWRVNARNAAGNSAFSTRRSLTTQSTPPAERPYESFTLRFRGEDGGGGRDTLFYARDPRATYCIDPYAFFEGTRTYTEFELPPPPPSGVFDIRFANHRAGLGGCILATERGNGLRYDVRGLTGSSQIDTFQLRLQIGSSGPMNLFWQDGLGVFCDSAKLRDLFGGFLVNVNMRTTQTVSITNPAITGLYVILYRAPGVLLIAPSNGNTVPPSVNLQWNGNEDATKYRVQVSTDSLFSSFVVHDSLVTGTSRLVSGLASPGTYYWRVSAGNDYGFGAFSQTRVFHTGSVPAAPALVSPADGATGQPTSLSLVWSRSTGASTYHLQVSTDPGFAGGFVVNDSTITDSTFVVSGLAFSTTYHWRVSARNGVGGGPFSASRSFATQLQPPPAPVLTTPANNAVNQPTTIDFAWTGSGPTFRLQVGTDSTFASGIFFDDSTIAANTRQVTGFANNAKYYWRVRAKNGAGNGPYSSTFNFTTVIAPPPAPALATPPDGATNVSQTPNLVWNPASGATTYRLQVARDTAFTQITVDDSTLIGTSRAIGPLLSNTTYFWRVRARNAGGNSAYSTRFRFTTTAAPPIPAQVAPVDSATRVARTPTFIWNRVPGATAYHLQISSDPGFGTVLYNDSTIVDSARTAGPFPFGARLHWRIRSKNTAGTSPFSVPKVFTIMLEPPAVPTLVSPANNAINQSVTPTLRWRSTSLAATYDLQIALDTLMSNIVVADSGITDSSRVVRIAPSTAYYWRVRGQNTEGTNGLYSVVRRFSTGNLPPATPIPTFPVSGDTGVSRTPRLRWVGSPGSLQYRVQISRDNIFNQIVADDSTVTDLYYDASLLLANTQYYWRVRARGTSGWSAYSVIQNFLTGTLIVSVKPPDEQVQEFFLYQNYPNPFNPSTTIPFSLSREALVTVTIYNTMGEEVRDLVSDRFMPGQYSLRWDGFNADGNHVTTGVYLVRMTAAASGERLFVSTKKILLLK